jgi:hypothetical protein
MTVATREPQHLRALAIANSTRFARVEARRALREAPNASEARRRAAALIEENPAELQGMAVFDLLRSCHRHGRAKVLPILRRAELPESKPIGSLTERQRVALAGVLRG